MFLVGALAGVGVGAVDLVVGGVNADGDASVNIRLSLICALARSFFCLEGKKMEAAGVEPASHG